MSTTNIAAEQADYVSLLGQARAAVLQRVIDGNRSPTVPHTFVPLLSAKDTLALVHAAERLTYAITQVAEPTPSARRK